MHLTIFSLAMAVIWVSISVKLISVFRKQMSVLQYFSIYPLLIILLFCILRMVFPLELPQTIVINSKKLFPTIQYFLFIPLFTCGYIKVSPAFILGTIWFLGAAIIAAGHIRAYHRFHHLMDFLPASTDKHLHHLLAEADTQISLKIKKIIVHNAVESPVIVGCIHPVILLPEIDFDDEELLGIFIHETAHYRYKHHFIKLFTEIICICFWWNPPLKKLSAETEHALEMHSDQTVCAKLTCSQQRKYLSGIIKVVENVSRPNSPNFFSCSLVEETDDEKLTQRFKMILGNHYQNNKNFNRIITILILSFFLLSYTFVIQPYSEPDLSEYGNIDTATSDLNYYFIKTKEGYDFYEYPDRFIAHMDEVPFTLDGIKIYKNMKEAKTK